MRYARGTLALSATRDLPLLLLIRNSRFITHEQLYELMLLGSYEHSRNSFNWRIRRLLQGALISTSSGGVGRGMTVYHVSRTGLCYLEDAGYFATTLNSATRQLAFISQVRHALELNSVRLALAKARLLASWESDVEIGSLNTIATQGAGKDYDAIVGVWNGSELARFGLEYERTLKSANRYRELRDVLDRDPMRCVLYLTSGFEVACHLLNELSGISKRLAFATIPNFREGLLDTLVMVNPHQAQVPFRSLLQGIF